MYHPEERSPLDRGALAESALALGSVWALVSA
jgi:hypothetical protein